MYYNWWGREVADDIAAAVEIAGAEGIERSRHSLNFANKPDGPGP